MKVSADPAQIKKAHKTTPVNIGDSWAKIDELRRWLGRIKDS